MLILVLVVLLSIVLLANVGLHEPWAARSARLLMGALNGSMALFGLWALVGVSQATAITFGEPAIMAAFLAAARELGIVSLATAVVATLLLFLPVRRALVRVSQAAQVGDLDAESPVHMTMLVFTVYLLAWMWMQWLLAGSIDELAELSGPVLLGDVLLSGVMAVAFAVMGAGLGVRRTWRETLERLGLGAFDTRSVLVGVSGAVGMLAFLSLAAGLWFTLAPENFEAYGSAAEILFSGFASVPAAVVVAVSTALGEELLFRGALQPRLGLLPTSLLFAVLHVQYTLSPAWLIIFVVGLSLGLLRLWRNTTAAVVAHFVYNFALLAAAAVQS